MTLLPKVKLKTIVSFPAAVNGGTGIAVSKENGQFTFDLDFAQFAPPVGGLPDSNNENALLWNKVTGQYVLAPISLFGGAAGIPEAANDGVQYGRQSFGWTPIVHPPPPVGEASLDGRLYGRQSGNWSPVVIPTSQPVYSFDLRDWLDSYYGPGFWTQRTGVGAGSDIGPAITAGLAAARASGLGRGILRIPPGTWLMNTSPNGLMGWFVEGAGSQASKVVYNATFTSAFVFDAGAGLTPGYSGGGIKGVGIFIESGRGTAHTCGAVYVGGDTTAVAGQMEFRDLYISSMDSVNTFWYQGIQVNGSTKPTEPRGSRGATWDNIQIFCCKQFAFHGSILVQHTFSNVGTYVGFTTTGMDFYIVGTSAHVYATCLNVGGALNVDTTPVTGGTDIWINGTRRAALVERKEGEET